MCSAFSYHCAVWAAQGCRPTGNKTAPCRKSDAIYGLFEVAPLSFSLLLMRLWGFTWWCLTGPFKKGCVLWAWESKMFDSTKVHRGCLLLFPKLISNSNFRGTTYQKNCLRKNNTWRKYSLGSTPKLDHPRRRLGISSALLSDGLCFFLIFNVFVIILGGCVGSSLLCVDFSLVVVSRGYSSAAMHRLLTVVASLVEQRL